METGIELIAKERREQIEKHGRAIEADVSNNDVLHLCVAAHALTLTDQYGQSKVANGGDVFDLMPRLWDDGVCHKMCGKPYKERLIIAGALIAAEIDRLQYIESQPTSGPDKNDVE